jgi:hypothetical protein
VPPNEISAQCAGTLQRSEAQLGQQANWSVTCDAAKLRLTFISSLVGQPRTGYAAHANLVSPRRTFEYSEWIYDQPALITAVMEQWSNYLQADHKGSTNVTRQTNALDASGRGEFGMPWWGRVAQKGNRLVVIKVSALPSVTNPPSSASEMEQWLKNLKPEDASAAHAFFQKAAQDIERKFLSTP